MWLLANDRKNDAIDIFRIIAASNKKTNVNFDDFEVLNHQKTTSNKSDHVNLKLLSENLLK